MCFYVDGHISYHAGFLGLWICSSNSKKKTRFFSEARSIWAVI